MEIEQRDLSSISDEVKCSLLGIVLKWFIYLLEDANMGFNTTELNSKREHMTLVWSHGEVRWGIQEEEG